MLFFVINHIVACLWIICGTMVSTEDEAFAGTWLEDRDTDEPGTIYMISLYWTFTTITTVGYGDISGTNNIERIFCSVVMVVGVLAFSFVNGSLSSILTNADSTNAIAQDQKEMIEKIQADFNLPPDLVKRIKRSLLMRH